MVRVLVIVAALLLGLVGLAMSLCGGGVVIMTISGPSTEFGFLTIAVPCLLVGILFVWLSVVIWRKKINRSARDP